MYDNLIERINRGKWQQVVAFFILWFAIYSISWTIIEPLGLTIGPNYLLTWRLVYVGCTLLITGGTFFFFLYKRKLERFGLEDGDTDVSKVAIRNGTASISIIQDGYHGQVFQIYTNQGQNFIDIDVRASAHKARFIILTYKPDPYLFFYARVSVVSKNNQADKLKWLRFETTRSTYQSIQDDEEMGIPVTATDDNGFLRITINLSRTIHHAFGRHGWRYNKILTIRARGTGKLKNIILK